MYHDKEFYQEVAAMENAKATELSNRLNRIAAMAREELDRIEKHGGCAGFAARVWRLAGGDTNHHDN